MSLRGYMRVLGFILFLFSISANEAYARAPWNCQKLFIAESTTTFQFAAPWSDEQTLLAILKIQETDRVELFAARPRMSVAAFIDEIIDKKYEQLERFRIHNWSSVSVPVRDHYAALFELSVKGTSQGIRRLYEFPNFAQLTLEQMIHPEPHLEPIRSALMSFLVQSNTVLAEFMAALRFPQVVQTETSINGLIAPYAPWVYAPLQQKLGVHGWGNFLNRKMDVISRDPHTYYWVEVKYLGRHKRYTSVSGADVYEKLKNTKELAQLLPIPIRVTLAVVGPGWLSLEAVKQYEDLGVEVISLTPNY